MLKKYDITHVVNCAADYCENWFEGQGINYLAFFLKDSQNESIECLFYRVIEFVQTALKNKKKTLIHCIQGISRSVTMVIAYVMFVYEYDYKKAEAFVKQRRGVASPNNGFMVELIQFHKRLY
jgi:protein-tyrosine phosphatase